MNAFDFAASRLSKFFYSKEVNNNEEFVRVWDRHVLPLMDPSTGIITTLIGDQNDSSLLSETNPQTPVTSGHTTPFSSRLVSIKQYIFRCNPFYSDLLVSMPLD